MDSSMDVWMRELIALCEKDVSMQDNTHTILWLGPYTIQSDICN